MKCSAEVVLAKALETSAQEFVSLVAHHQSRDGKSILKALLRECSIQLAVQICDALAIATNLALGAYRELQEQRKHVPHQPAFPDISSPPTQYETRSRRAKGKKRAPNTPSDSGCGSPSIKETLEKESRRIHLDRQTSQILKTLRGCILIANVGLTEAIDIMQPSLLFPTVSSLHAALVFLEADPKLQDAIAGLCEFWWREKLDGRESLIVQCLPYLLSKALSCGRKKDIQRVYGMRNALSLFDFFDDSIEDMKHLLIRSVVTPTFLRTHPGRRFVSFLFGLNPQLVKELIVVVRSQIPFGRKSILEAYGEILYQAWKAADGACLHEIEYTCIQGLFEGALYASTKSLGASVRAVLEAFAAQKAHDGVEAMIFRLLEPLLFRALQVANSNVRENAILVFVDVFPLEDPHGSKEEKEALLAKQFGLMEKLLIDPCPDVRSLAVEVVFRILRLFWEIIPSEVTVNLLTKVVDDLAHDCSSNLVRLAVLKGVSYLLENAESHTLLKKLLPRLGSMLNDTSLSVRVAAADLLLVIKGIRVIQFYKVVQLDSLLVSLATDKSLVAQRLTRLLLPSYFPQKVHVKEACKRCIVLLKRSPSAGAQFCKWLLTEGASVESLLELVETLSSVAMAEDDLTDEVRRGVLLGLSEVCQSLVALEEWKTVIAETLTGDILAALIGCAPDSLARSYVLQIASRLPPKNVVQLVNYCSDLVMKCSVTPDDLAEVKAVHTLVLSWGGLDNLLGALVHLLSCSNVGNMGRPALAEVRAFPAKKHKRGSKWVESECLNVSSSSVSNQMEPKKGSRRNFVAAAGAAWQLETLLTGDETRQAVLRSSRMKELLQPLRKLAQIAIEWAGEASVGLPSICYAASPVLAYMKLYLHILLEVDKESSHALEKNGPSLPGRQKPNSTLEMLTNISEGFEAAWEELAGWLRIMLTNGSRKNGTLASTASEPKAKHARFNRRLCHREPLSPLSGNIVCDPKSKVRKDDVVAIITVNVLQIISDSFTLGVINTPSVRQVSADLIRDCTQLLIERFSQEREIEGKELQGEHWATAKATLTYAAKSLCTHLRDGSNEVEGGCILWDGLLKLIAALPQQKSKS